MITKVRDKEQKEGAKKQWTSVISENLKPSHSSLGILLVFPHLGALLQSPCFGDGGRQLLIPSKNK